jgi:TRAP-type C4-dicarboxylate transport system permease small subunit
LISRQKEALVRSVENVFRRINEGGMTLGAFFLLAMMTTVVANVIYRFFGHVIVGSYELVELMILVTVSFALGYTAQKKSHVVINILITRFPSRVQSTLEAIMSFISLATWGIIAWASANILIERWLRERTEMLDIPYLPFRFIWLFGLILLCLVYMLWIYKSSNEAVKK